MKKQISVKISNDKYDALKYSPIAKNMGAKFDTVLGAYFDMKFIIVEIRNKRLNKVFIYIERFDLYYSDTYKTELYSGNYPISYDLNFYGWDDFTIKSKGIYQNAKDANFTMMHMVNYYIDSGEYLYNNDIMSGKYQKFLYIPIKLKTYEKILDYCIENKIKYKKLVKLILKNFFLS